MSAHNLILIASTFEGQVEKKKVSQRRSFDLLPLETLPYGLSLRLVRPGGVMV